MPNSRGCTAYALALLLTLGVIAGWAEFLFKPLNVTPKQGFGTVALDLLSFVPETYGWPLAGYVFILSTLVLLFLGTVAFVRPIRWVIGYLEGSEAPVSVLQSHIKLYMEDTALSECRTSRVQRLHANRAKVEAYHYAFSAVEGQVVPGSVRISSRIGDENLTVLPLIDRKEGKTIEIIEQFARPLPTSILVTYLPDALVRKLHDMHLFGKVIVERTVSTTDRNEYNGADPLFQITAVHYPASDLEICLNFPIATAPLAEHVKSYLISTSAVQKVYVDHTDEGGRRIFKAKVRYLRKQQSFRIQWSNERLQAWQATQGQATGGAAAATGAG